MAGQHACACLSGHITKINYWWLICAEALCFCIHDENGTKVVACQSILSWDCISVMEVLEVYYIYASFLFCR